MSKKTNKVTAKFLLDKLEQEGVVLLREVRNKAAHHANRSLDGMSFGTWPSKGTHMVGYEVKINRSDWKKEIEDIEKSEAFRPFCKYFYLVSSKNIAEFHEIPETWGWLEWDGRRMVTVKPAPENKSIQPLPSTMLAAITKRCHDSAFDRGKDLMREIYEEKLSNFDEEVKKGVDAEFRYGQKKREAVDEFMEAIGRKGYEYNIERLTKNETAIDLIRFFVNNKKDGLAWNHPMAKINGVIESLERYAKVLDEARSLQEKITSAVEYDTLTDDVKDIKEETKKILKRS